MQIAPVPACRLGPGARPLVRPFTPCLGPAPARRGLGPARPGAQRLRLPRATSPSKTAENNVSVDLQGAVAEIRIQCPNRTGAAGGLGPGLDGGWFGREEGCGGSGHGNGRTHALARHTHPTPSSRMRRGAGRPTPAPTRPVHEPPGTLPTAESVPQAHKRTRTDRHSLAPATARRPADDADQHVHGHGPGRGTGGHQRHGP